MNETLHMEEEHLWKYFAGELSLEEQEKVKRWIGLSDENRKIAHDLEYLYRSTDVIRVMASVDSDKEFTKVKNKISQPRSVKVPVFMWFQRIAAILFLPLLLSFGYYMTKEDSISYVEVFTNPGMVAAITLPDSSKVWLNSDSYLRYPEKFKGDSRNVSLDGEAYFSVHKDPSCRFVVSTPSDLNIEVLGTEFNVDAYKDNHKISTSLVSGSVKLSFTDSHKHLMMKPEEKIDYDLNTQKIYRSKACLEMLTAWKHQRIIFKDTPFKEVLYVLEKRFNASFVVKNKAFYDFSYTGVFEKQQITSILEHFKFASDIQYRYVSVKKSDGTPADKLVIELY